MGQKLRGLVAQGIAGRKVARVDLIALTDATSSTGSYTPTVPCTALIYAWGAGGSGAYSNAATSSGGGGGAVGYKRQRIAAGQTVSWSVGAGGAEQNTDANDGNDGGDTTVTLPDGRVLTAGGGKKGIQGTSPKTGGVGGLASGAWDVSRSGGAGGDGVTGASTAGGSPTGGGTGGTANSGSAGGGAAAGLTDLTPGILGGNGGTARNTTESATAPGGGSGGAVQNTETWGGKSGRVLIQFIRQKLP